MKKIICILLCILLVLMVGCKSAESSKEESLIGMWYEEDGGTYLTFNEDNTCRFGQVVAKYETEGDKLTFIIDDNVDEMFYTVEVDTLTITFSESEDFELIYKRIKQ